MVILYSTRSTLLMRIFHDCAVGIKVSDKRTLSNVLSPLEQERIVACYLLLSFKEHPWNIYCPKTVVEFMYGSGKDRIGKECVKESGKA